MHPVVRFNFVSRNISRAQLAGLLKTVWNILILKELGPKFSVHQALKVLK